MYFKKAGASPAPTTKTMSDITKCNGAGCKIKESCYRYMAKSSEPQSYFLESPIKDGKCEMYWGETAQSVYNQLKDIMK